MLAERHLVENPVSSQGKAEEHANKLSLVSGVALLTSVASICFGAGPVAGFIFLPEVIRQGIEMDKAKFQSESLKSKLTEA